MKKVSLLLILCLFLMPLMAQDDTNQLEDPSLLEEIYQEFAFRAIQSLDDQQGKVLVDSLTSSGAPLQASVQFQGVVLKELLYSLPDMEIYDINNYFGSIAEMDYRIFGEVFNEEEVIFISLRLVDNQTSRLMAIQNFTIPAGTRWGTAFIPQISMSGGMTMDRSEPNDSAQNATRISFPMDPLPASFHSSSDEDYYMLTLPADLGDTYITARTTGGTDTVMTLYGPDNASTYVEEDDDGGESYNSRISFEAHGGQTWWIKMRAYSDGGDYQLIVELADEGSFQDESNDDFSTAFPMSFDEISSGYYSYNDNGDYFSLNIPEEYNGQLIRVFTDQDIDTELYFYDEESARYDDYLMYNDDSEGYAASISFVGDSQEQYYIKLTAYDEGPYQIFLEVMDTEGAPYEMNDDFSMATPIEINEIQRHSFFHSMDQDYLVFEITNGGRYAIETFGNADPYVTVFSEEEYQIASDDDSGDDMNSYISVNLDEGIYYLHIESAVYDDTGSYRVEISPQQ